jgi:hypothetical protein
LLFLLLLLHVHSRGLLVKSIKVRDTKGKTCYFA